jgi:non-ribosomal peptide synthetase component E (peptide arylation enzyme)
MKRIIVLTALTFGLLAVGPGQAALPKLVGTTGPGFTITLKKSGTKVTKLKAGKYSLTVSDLSSQHNFHLTGPGVNKKTTVGGTGKTTWTVTLQKGKTFRFVCDPHASTMKGSFKTI